MYIVQADIPFEYNFSYSNYFTQLKEDKYILIDSSGNRLIMNDNYMDFSYSSVARKRRIDQFDQTCRNEMNKRGKAKETMLQTNSKENRKKC